MPKIISFCPIQQVLRDAVRAEGYDDDKIYGNAPLWAEAVEEVSAWLADPHMVLDDLGSDVDGDAINSLFGDIWEEDARDELYVFVAPLEGGASAIVRAKLAADLHAMNNIPDSQDKPAQSALYVWDGAALRKIDLDDHA